MANALYTQTDYVLDGQNVVQEIVKLKTGQAGNGNIPGDDREKAEGPPDRQPFCC